MSYGLVQHADLAAGSSVENYSFARNGGLKVAMSQAKYQDAVLRGKCFTGMTAVTGVAPGTSVGTTAAFSLYNPYGSGVYLSLLRVSMGLISGTLGAGTVLYVANLNSAAAATTGTAITVTNCLLGAGSTPQGKPLTTATLPATPTVLRPFCSLTEMVIATTAVNNERIFEDVDGSIIIPPGMTLSLEGVAAAGSSPLVVYGVMWEEITVG